MSSLVHRLLVLLGKQVPTVLVLSCLAALFVWGAANKWQLPSLAFWEKPEEKKPQKDSSDNSDPAQVLSENAGANAGLEHAPAQQQSLPEYVEAPASLAFEHNYYAQLAPKASGTAWRVLRSFGDSVKKGELLALIASASVAMAKAEFLNAYTQSDIRQTVLERLLNAGDAVPERQVREAELSVREGKIRLLNAHQALVNLGLPLRLEELRGKSDEEISHKLRLLGLPSSLASEENLPGNLLPMVAPFEGQVIRREIVVGEIVSPTQPVFFLGDVRKICIEMDVRQEDIARLVRGQEVTFRCNATDQSVTGFLKWISSEVDAKTRTVRAHADVDNPYGELRPATFGRARILVQRNNAALTVPDNALQWTEGSYRVFVQMNKTTYDPRVALRGARSGGRTQLLDTRVLLAASLAGRFACPGAPLPALASFPMAQRVLKEVKPGELVVTTGSHVLKSELFKSRIDAGE